MISRFIFLREWCRFWWWWWLLFLNKENPTEDVGEVENQLEKKCHRKDDVKMILRFEEQYVEASEVKKGWWWGWRNSYFSKKKKSIFFLWCLSFSFKHHLRTKIESLSYRLRTDKILRIHAQAVKKWWLRLNWELRQDGKKV